MKSDREQSGDKGEVGEWIRLRFDQLGINATEFARRTGVGYRTVMSAVNGQTAVTQRRAEWERELQWEPGSLYRAYKYGTRPTPIGDAADVARMSGPDLVAHVKDLMARLPEDDVVLRRTAQLLLDLVEERTDGTERERGAS